jgi:hypothetical protein
MRTLRGFLSVLAGALIFIVPSPASAWAPAATAPIHPGVNTDTQGNSCTSNFIYQSGSTVYIGQAAHCSSTGAATDTNGCTAQSMPEGTKVNVDGASQPGIMVYNSWIRMQQSGETDPDTCAFNDLALVQLSPADAAKVNPSVPKFGGPTGLRGSVPMTTGSKVYSYGNSILRAGVQALSPKYGVQVGPTSNSGWHHTVYTVTPGIPGDSGSGFFDANGRAFGILSTVAVLPLPASNGVGDLPKELAWASSHGFSASLVKGTVPFKAPQIP